MLIIIYTLLFVSMQGDGNLNVLFLFAVDNVKNSLFVITSVNCKDYIPKGNLLIYRRK